MLWHNQSSLVSSATEPLQPVQTLACLVFLLNSATSQQILFLAQQPLMPLVHISSRLLQEHTRCVSSFQQDMVSSISRLHVSTLSGMVLVMSLLLTLLFQLCQQSRSMGQARSRLCREQHIPILALLRQRTVLISRVSLLLQVLLIPLSLVRTPSHTPSPMQQRACLHS